MTRLRDEFGKVHNEANPVPVDIVDATGVTIDVDVNQVNDGDAIDTNSDGNLNMLTTAVPGTARAWRGTSGGSGLVNLVDSSDAEVGTAGNPLGMDVISALPSGTNNIGDVDIASALPAGTNNIGDVDVLTLPDVTQSTHDSLNANCNLQIADADVSTSNAVPVEGRASIGTAITGNPVPVGVRDLVGQVEYLAGNDLGASIAPALTQLFDAGLVSINFASDGSCVVVGNTAHDAVDADAGEGPVKIGYHAIDYDPDTDAEQGRAEVAAADRADAAANLRGQLIEGVNSRYHVWSNISTDYDTTSTETQTSDTIEVWNYRVATISFDLTVTGTPTDIEFVVLVSMDGTNFARLMNGGLGSWKYDDLVIGSGIERAYTFPICANDMKIEVNATGLSAGVDEFTVANAAIFLRN